MSACAGCRPTAIAPPRANAAEVAWRYDVEIDGPDADVLRVDAVFAPSAGPVNAAEALAIDPSVAPFVRDLEIDDEPGSAAERRGRRVRYRFALREAAEAIREVETAFEAGGLIVAPPSTWLLHPARVVDARLLVRIASRDGASFASAFARAPRGAPARGGIAATAELEAPTRLVDDLSFAVFGRFALSPLAAFGAELDVAAGGAPIGALRHEDVTSWVGRSANALGAYYGEFRVPRLLIAVLPGTARETRGETLNAGAPAIVVRAAQGLTDDDVRHDWVVTHELVHATLPSFGREHAWLDEGIATYVEPIARARAGLVDDATYWRELAEGLPNGLPESGDEGLDRTHTWGRTYWGGALFCFLADVEIRTVTLGRRSFDDVVRALAAEPLDASRVLAVERFASVADAATGTDVVSRLVRSLALAPGAVDLAALWAKLGVRSSPQGVAFDDNAPLAWVRRDVTRPGPRPGN